MKKTILISLLIFLFASSAFASSLSLRHVEAGKIVGIIPLQNQEAVVFIDTGEAIKAVAIDKTTSYSIGYLPRRDMVVEACGLSAWVGLSDPAEVYEIQLPQPASSCSTSFVYYLAIVGR